MMIVKEVYLFWHESNKQTNKQKKTSFQSKKEDILNFHLPYGWKKHIERMKDGFERKLRIFVCVCGIKWKPNKYHFWDLIT